jgi:hypothetical protein
MKPLRAIDICAGAGGWAVAARGLPIEIVAAFDLQQDALETYAFNHPGTETILTDITVADFSRWKGIDLILGGIPCEQISAYRSMHKTSEGEIAALLRLIQRCISLPSELGAKWWCYEDVCRLEKHLPILTPSFQVCSSSHSPQRRKRMFVGNLPCPETGADERTLSDALRKGPYRIGPRLRGRRPCQNNSFKPDTFYPWRPEKKVRPSSLSPLAGIARRPPRPANIGASSNGRNWRSSRASLKTTSSAAARVA